MEPPLHAWAHVYLPKTLHTSSHFSFLQFPFLPMGIVAQNEELTCPGSHSFKLQTLPWSPCRLSGKCFPHLDLYFSPYKEGVCIISKGQILKGMYMVPLFQILSHQFPHSVFTTRLSQCGVLPLHLISLSPSHFLLSSFPLSILSSNTSSCLAVFCL